MSVVVPDAVLMSPRLIKRLMAPLLAFSMALSAGPSVCLSLMPMIAHGIVAFPNSPALTVYVRIGTPIDVEGSLVVLSRCATAMFYCYSMLNYYTAMMAGDRRAI